MKSAKHIADRIRLMIATKQFQVGEILPSTRILGKQLGSSFHTVRKAYQMLEGEGLLKSEHGRGYVVSRQNTLLDKSERLEKGAEKFRELLEELIGYGLDEEEVETLFQEQLNFMEWPERINSCATVGITREIAAMLADAIRSEVGVKSSILIPEEKNKTVNYDALFLPVAYKRMFQPDSESLLLPVIYHISDALILSLAERPAVNSLGIVAGEDASLPTLAEEARHALNFTGTVKTGVLHGRSLPVFVHEVDYVLYTKPCSALIEKQLPSRKRGMFTYELSPKSADQIRSELWDDY